MSVTFNVVRNRPKIVLQLGAILLLPWVWAAFVMPLWVSAVCAALWAVAFPFAIHLFVVPRFRRQRASDSSLTPEQLMEMRAPTTGMFAIDPQTVRGDLDSLHSGLRRWQETSSVSSGETATARDRVGEVISQTERAVLALTLSFRGITTKTRQQMETAMSLLKRSADQANISPGGWLSLPDYIRAYEMQLLEVVESMVKFSAASDEMLHHQTRIRDQSVLIDELLDELRSMATRIGRLALDSSMVAGESGKHRDHLIELSDSIRETSNKTFDLTRTVRKSLETIRDELVVTYKVINKTAVIAKESAQRAKADVAQLNITMIAKTREVEESLSKINSLGGAIQEDVNNAFIAMQFQDITQQQLEHMRGNVLADVVRTMDTLSVEAQEMMKKQIFLDIQADAKRLNVSLGDRPKAALDANGAAGSSPSAAEVELF